MREQALLFGVFCCFIASVLHPVKSQVHHSIIITGKITGTSSTIVTVFKDDVYDFVGRSVQVGTAKINENGNFKLLINSFSPEIYYLQIDQRFMQFPLYLTTGDSIDIQINIVDKRWEYTFTGTSEKINQFEQKRNKAFPRDAEYEKNRWQPKSFSQFRDYIDARKENQFEFYHKYFHDNSLPDKFKSVFESRIMYNWTWERADFLLSFYYFPDKPYIKFDSTFFSFENSISLTDSPIALTSDYRSFLERYIYLLAMDWRRSEEKKGNIINDLVLCKKKFELAKTKFSGFPRDVAMAEAIEDIPITKSSIFIALAKKNIEEFKLLASNKKYFDSFQKHFDKIYSLSPGQPAPDFTAPNIDGKQITLSSFKGKVVYLDFWATWCAPCIEEIPNTIELQKKFSSDDVVFIFAALEEKNQKGWKEVLKKKDLSGVQIYLEGRTENPVAKKYNIGGLPRFILVDQEGKIIINREGVSVNDKGESLTQSGIKEKISELLKKK